MESSKLGAGHGLSVQCETPRFTGPASPFSAPVAEVVQALQESTSSNPQQGAVGAPTLESCAQGKQEDAAQTSCEAKCSLSVAQSLLASVLASTSGTGCVAPPHGVKAVCGKRAKMEDAFSVQTNFVDVPLSPVDAGFTNKLPARIALQIGEQLEQNTCSPPMSTLSPHSPSSTACVPSLSCSDTEASMVASTTSSSANTDSCCDTLHFFGVYDGHGGVEAAQHCANRLHYHLSVALAEVVGAGTMHTHDAFCVAGGNGVSSTAVQCQAEWNFCSHEEPVPPEEQQQQGASDGKPSNQVAPGCGPCCDPLDAEQEPCGSCKSEKARIVQDHKQPAEEVQQGGQEELPAAGGHAVSEEGSPDQEDSASSGSSGETTHSEGSSSAANGISAALENALRAAFLKTDEEFAEDGSSAMVGSTAVVALVGTKKMWIANCGDSRAVLCRGGKAIQVTDDHKPEREDEAERVEKAGGQVLYWNGHRVMGVLAMSRAIGDHGLRPYVIPEPEITVLARVVEDDFLLLASDGLWDVMTNQDAIGLAMRCMQRAWDKGTSRKAAVRVAATVLTRAAVDLGSKDNVTVVIIDLKAPQPTSSDGKQETLASCEASCTPSNAVACDHTCAAAAAAAYGGGGEGAAAAATPNDAGASKEGQVCCTPPCGALERIPEGAVVGCCAKQEAAAAAAAAAQGRCAAASSEQECGACMGPQEKKGSTPFCRALAPSGLPQAACSSASAFLSALVQQDTLVVPPSSSPTAAEAQLRAKHPFGAGQGEGRPYGGVGHAMLPRQATLASSLPALSAFASVTAAVTVQTTAGSMLPQQDTLTAPPPPIEP